MKKYWELFKKISSDWRCLAVADTICLLYLILSVWRNDPLGMAVAILGLFCLTTSLVATLTGWTED